MPDSARPNIGPNHRLVRNSDHYQGMFVGGFQMRIKIVSVRASVPRKTQFQMGRENVGFLLPCDSAHHRCANPRQQETA